MESKTLHLLEYPKILDALSKLAKSEAGLEACLSIAPYNTFEEIEKAGRLYSETAEWIGESGAKLKNFPALGGMFQYLEGKFSLLDQDALFALRTILTQALAMRENLLPYKERGWDHLTGLVLGTAWPEKTVSGINRCLDQEGRIRDESSPDLLAVRQEIRNIHQRCTKHVKDYVLSEGLGDFLQDEFMTVSSDRYVLPLKSTFKRRLKGIIHDYSQTGETCYFEPMFLVDTNNRLQDLKREEREEERKVLQYLTDLVRQEAEAVEGCYRWMVALDVEFAKFHLADKLNGKIVELSAEGLVELRNCKHPLLALTDDKVQSINVELQQDHKALIISGGNAGGKTVCLKTLGLIALMTYSGLPVPADEGSVLPAWKDIFVVMGDDQSLEESVSTFTAQIKYLSTHWDRTGADTLFILDEFGAGTDPTQGAALAQAVIESLMERNATAVVATHFPALKAYAMATEGVRAASVLFDPGTKKPLFRLAYDQVGASIALDVAREHGLPSEILERAERTLLLDGSDTSMVLDKLNALAVEREQELKEARAERLKLEKKRVNLEAKFTQKRDKMLQEIQSQAQTVVKEWKSGKIARKQTQKKLSDLREKLSETGEQQATNQVPTFSYGDLEIGMKVLYSAWNKTGTVLELNERKKQAKVDVNGVAMWVRGEHLSAPGGVGKPVSRQISTAAPVQAAMLSVKVDLRGMRAAEALSELERSLDAALLKGAGELEIIHGRGTGALRREVHDFLGIYPAVASFDIAPEDQGGDGKTVALLK